jgi:hypothetical protein
LEDVGVETIGHKENSWKQRLRSNPHRVTETYFRYIFALDAPMPRRLQPQIAAENKKQTKKNNQSNNQTKIPTGKKTGPVMVAPIVELAARTIGEWQKSALDEIGVIQQNPTQAADETKCVGYIPAGA